MVVGKVVQFTVLYNIPTGVNRDYGTVFLQTGESLPKAAVAEGWVKLRDDAARKDDAEESKKLLEELELEQARAKAASKGMWGSNGGRIENTYDIANPKDFLAQWKGKSLNSIVERVLSGDRMIVRLFLSPTKHLQTMILVAGIRAPATKRTNASDGKEQPAEPFGGEAQQFVETRLLQRNVKVEILGISPQNQLICTVRHPNGSIAEFILKAGLARCTDFHSTLLGGEMTALRQAEKEAKNQQLGLFQGHVGTKDAAAGEVDATVTRIQTADTVFLRTKSGVEKRVSLSSIRQPKPSDPKQGPFQADAKEFLRKKLIGKHVRITVDGKKAASDGYEEREVVTINLNKQNIALMLVEAGYASVIRHRRDDGTHSAPLAAKHRLILTPDDRSPIYDALLAAEDAAQKEEKGMWSSKPPAAKTYQDYSETLQKAKIHCSVLQRQKRVPAVVDFVKSGSRFTILIPRENAKLTFVLSGIRAPRSARNPGEQSEAFGQEAHDFATRRCMQRDVEIDVENTDKMGGFIGTLYINRDNFAKLLLEEGLASVHAYSAEQSGHATELRAAEQKAKDARKGRWQNYDPDAADSANDSSKPSTPPNGAAPGSAPADAKQDYRDVLITNVEATGAFKMQIISPTTTTALTSLMNEFRLFHRSAATSLPGPPKAGDLVAARYSEDGEWYRARVRRNDREHQRAEVVFIDYGNAESLPWSSLRPLTQPQFSLQALRPQAVEGQLSFCQLPRAAGYLREAVGFLTNLANRQLVARVDLHDKDTWWVTLFEPDGDEADSVNAHVIGEGLALAGGVTGGKPGSGNGNGKPPYWKRVQDVLRAKEASAQKGRLGMWEYGDLTED
jgi:staphylococcal nuclease domain-containing protein 1